MQRLVIIFILFSFVGNAQNWNVFNKGYRYNYKFDNSLLVSNVMFCESATVVAGDTIYNMNKVGAYDGTTLKLNVPQFLMRKIVKGVNGNVRFLDTANITLIPNCALNQSWIFDSINNLLATCVAITVENNFSTNDSIRTILVNNVDSIKLSKNFGILLFPQFYAQNKYYRLVGIEKAKRYEQHALFGEKVPNAWDFYNFRIGDELCEQFSYRHDDGCGNHHNCYKKVMTILTKTVTPTGYIYNIGQNHLISGLSHTWCAFTTSPYSYVNLDVSYDNLDTCARLENVMYPGMVGQAPANWYLNLVRFGTQGNNNNFCKIFGEVSTSSFNYITPQTNPLPLSFTYVDPDTYTVCANNYDKAVRLYSKGHGKTVDIFGYWSREEILTSSCSVLMGLSENTSQDAISFFYPNPAKTKLNLKLDGEAEIKLFNSFGSLMLNKTLQDKDGLDISELPNGIYFIEVQMDSFIGTQKLIIQH